MNIRRNFSFFFVFFVWLIFALPYFIKNTIPFPSTYQQTNFAPWSAYKQYIGPVKNGAMPDLITQIFPWKYFSIQELKHGKIPFWNPSGFGGTPHLANYQSAVFSPFNILFFILPFVNAWRLLVLFQPLLAGIFMLLFTKKIGLRSASSTIAAISFMFCGFITVWMAYATLGYAILFLPLALYAVESYEESKKSRFLFLLSISFPLSFFSGHFQISIYFSLVVLFFILYKLFIFKNIKNTIYLLISLFIGFLFTLPQVLPSLEFYSQSMRSGLYHTSEIIPWEYLPTLLAPDFFGNPVTRNDWFGHYAEWNGYSGIVVLILSFYALLNLRKKYVLFFVILAGVSFVLAFPTPFTSFFSFLKIPVLGTSAASRGIVLFSFSISILGGMGFQFLLDFKKNWVYKIAWIIISLFVVFALWIIIFFGSNLNPQQIYIARQNSIFPTIIAFLCLLFCFVLINAKGKIKIIFIALIILLVSFDMLRFVNKWMPFDPIKYTFSSLNNRLIFSNPAYKARIQANMESGVCAYYGFWCLGGYDSLYIDRYGTFIASLQTGKVTQAERSVVSFPRQGLNTLAAMNLLNVKYVLHKHSDDGVGWTFPFWQYPDQFKQIADDGVYKVLENKNVYPFAFLVNKYRIAKKDQDILDVMFARNTDLSKTLVLENPIKVELGSENNVGKLKIISQEPGKTVMQSSSIGNNLLFISIPFYPGWKAIIDGKSAKIMRADFAFQAVLISPGVHKIVFYYRPQSFFIGVIILTLGLLGLFSMRYLSRVL